MERAYWQESYIQVQYNYMEEMPWRKFLLPGSVDDYFPDYQLSCCMFTLLNRHAAQRERCKPLFLLFFLDKDRKL